MNNFKVGDIVRMSRDSPYIRIGQIVKIDNKEYHCKYIINTFKPSLVGQTLNWPFRSITTLTEDDKIELL
jgi:hypothetical protein